VFRIWHKQALGDMRSLPGDDSYTVEDVPWVMYFHRRFALHAAFWHNKFGRGAATGASTCRRVDAARVFGQTAPAMPAGLDLRVRARGRAGHDGADPQGHRGGAGPSRRGRIGRRERGQRMMVRGVR
jgi:hypothetical protein